MRCIVNETERSVALYNAIVERIAAAPQRRITFAEFMNLALYHPTLGYYTAPGQKIGGKGADFYTSPDVTPFFGQLIARQIVQCWQLMGQPANFTIVEQGAGVGRLAADILAALRDTQSDLYAPLIYAIVEISPDLRACQREAIPRNAPVIWYEQLAQVGPIEGVILSNELVDAFPVHIVQGQISGRLAEVYVTIEDAWDGLPFDPDGANLHDVVAKLSDPALAEYFARLGITIPRNNRAEVNLAMLDWLAEVASILQRGYVITIDYGNTADHLYSPRRTNGTLLCYYQHTLSGNPYQRLGRQDITALVDFTTLQQRGEQLGLHTLGLTNQTAFLTSLGLGDFLQQLPNLGLSDEGFIRQRAALLRLIEIGGLGRFQVLVQGKGVDEGAALAGLKFHI
jgi:SAM-dependent MidA family methyltransferase